MNLEKQLYFQQCIEEICQDEKVLSMNQNPQHGNTSCLEHSIAVAYFSYRFCDAIHLCVDTKSLIRGALLHDFFLYNRKDDPKRYRWHGFTHPKTALSNAENHFDLTKVEKDIIKNHMFPLTICPPRFREAYVVCLWDKICCVNELLRFRNKCLKNILANVFSKKIPA